MKATKIISIIVITVLCLGKANSQIITVPDNLSLSGTVTGNNTYEATGTIQSTQVISSGKTTYTAGDEVVLDDGFEVASGAEFEIIMDNFDDANHLTIMTYNLSTGTSIAAYNMHAEVIKACNPDVVAVQEVAWLCNYDRLKNKTGYKAARKCTRGWDHLYTVLMWKPSLGKPIDIVRERIKQTKYDEFIRYQAYIIAEFQDFCFIATHIHAPDKDTIINAILNENIVQSCISAGKPIYFAGDMNFEPNDTVVTGTLKNAGFEVLNDQTPCETNEPDTVNCKNYKYWTSHGRWLKDLILECNTNPKRKIIERGIPTAILENLDWKFASPHDTTGEFINYPLLSTDYNSDHFPYVVKVKIK